mmetsp:Transcript_20445/g.51807  ORF Transcript_20445/g.51807 Transcript_20445/m.51807 type:complete len:345 (-) Transcript_20445:672-1706(-)
MYAHEPTASVRLYLISLIQVTARRGGARTARLVLVSSPKSSMALDLPSCAVDCCAIRRLSSASLRAIFSACAAAAGSTGSLSGSANLTVGLDRLEVPADVPAVPAAPSLPVTRSLISFILAISFCMEDCFLGGARTLASAGLVISSGGPSDTLRPSGDRLLGGAWPMAAATACLCAASASACADAMASSSSSTSSGVADMEGPLASICMRDVTRSGDCRTFATGDAPSGDCAAGPTPGLTELATTMARCSASAASSSSSTSPSSFSSPWRARAPRPRRPPRLASEMTRLTTFLMRSSITLCRPKSTSFADTPLISGDSMMFSSLRSLWMIIGLFSVMECRYCMP